MLAPTPVNVHVLLGEGALWRVKMALALHGEFAVLNFDYYPV
jgi:hypothetical protein